MDSNIFINAVPGSGKTTKIVNKILQLIQKGVGPSKIYAITFTKEAANELKDRIDNKEVNASTIHSLAYSISDIDKKDNTFFITILKNATLKLKNKEVSLDIHFLAVDEAQDLSQEECEFIKELGNYATNILIVGDSMQSIFSFQGGDPIHMTSLSNYFNMKKEPMTLSYRLGKEIANYATIACSPPLDIESNKKESDITIHRSDKREVLKTISKLYRDKTINTGILLRTNYDVITVVKHIGHTNVNYIIPLSKHPIVNLTRCLIELDTGVWPTTISNAVRFLGHTTIGVMKTLRYIGKNKRRYTGDELSKLFNPNINKRKGIFIPYTDLYETDSSIDTLLYLKEKERKKITNTKDRKEYIKQYFTELNNYGYNVDSFWKKIPIDILIDATDKLLTTDAETYYTVDNKSNSTVMTIHAAKGKEFNNVITGVSPSAMINLYDHEELRIMYVAITRAKNKLEIVLPDIQMKEQGNIIDALSLKQMNI